MLNGFLTTALEIIIILDVCGAVVYVLAFSLRRASQKQAEQPVVASSTPGFTYGPTLNPALAGPSSVPPPLPEWAQEAVNRHGEPAPRPRVDVTVADTLQPARPESHPTPKSEEIAAEGHSGLRSLADALNRTTSKLMGMMPWKRKQSQEKPERTDINSDRVRLHRVLDSFREEA